MKNADKPAYPVSEETTDRIESGVNIFYGLTKREYFALHIMCEAIANSHEQNGPSYNAIKAHSMSGVLGADALLAELEKETENGS